MIDQTPTSQSFSVTDSLQNANLPDLGNLYEPPPVKFAFDTPGWPILFVTLSVIACVLAYRIYLQFKKNAYRKYAVSVIESIRTNKKDNSSGIEAINVVLKQVALQTFGRKETARLFGDEWLKFLESKANDTPFSKFGKSFSAALYQNGEIGDEEFDRFVTISKTWIHSHA
ncbi:hypothetical protein FUAX_40520 (plasmid) [Fulvitalea axinellae]|uniref:DUF4381 domain-containing protein n=1 Tax=Fulvitalea axinellae TaxID=1182444 RepID=A0AAU9DK46_9BACT|nr:hypothetical protein FUAX_40520 [Fulvitalea axinellae]